ncbi:MFS transporter [Bacillus sp. OK048]|uniref:MFS transporter n=1 Tax=Bacillus sp. OK048 TaxID=1882761 RepID=UPI000889EF60|nr:MFS transporter [Bacillus sp. OK048]SDM83661.1 Predicted arabinose efflux permease, MFS family [Bacillus sp. OK048]
MKQLITPLSERPYRKLFTAQVLSDLGNWLDFTAIFALVVYAWELSEIWVAALSISIGLPWVVVGPFASVFVDRLSRNKVMYICTGIRIAIAISLIFVPNIYFLLFLVLLKSTCGAIFDPAKQGAIRLTVSEENLAQAVTLSQLSVNSMKVIGPALGGALIATFGPNSPFIVIAFGFTIATLLLIGLPSLKSESTETNTNKTNRKFWNEFKEGLSHINRNFVLKLAIIGTAIVMFIIFLYDGLLVYLSQNLGFDEAGFGLMVSAIGLGSVVGSLTVGFIQVWKKHPLLFMSSTIIFSGSTVILMGIGGMRLVEVPLLLWLVFAFILGAVGAGATIPFGYILQVQTPSQLIGRVSSVTQSSQTFAMLIAPAIGAVLAETIGVGLLVAIAGSMTVFLGLIGLPIIFKLKQKVIVKENQVESV